ncbi:hypothetical protein [Sandaracinus amylolyticus]|uniref:Secreted protein n=1 Tax=Sandaracinus amylolyticus TaxID=927083 RepID=A0A0F6YHW9_9BACT|nr:hypothetical protein [Sandaracinus amylolyticus]AKF04472.1 hypothetical protein DB32_001621 [Sandaracinus amylolyticus]
MRALVAALLFVVLSLQVTGLLAIVAAPECACDDAGCDDEDECPPLCGDTDRCGGCYRPIAVVTAPLIAGATLPVERDSTFGVAVERRPLEPDPRGLLRIPRS